MLTPLSRSVRIGNIVPSSNTVLEPIMMRMAADLGPITTHFTRLRVTEISLLDNGLRQFDTAKFLVAAELLAEARVDVIAWNGTSGSWLGLDYDRAVCAEITRHTGVPATTSTLAFHEALQRLGITQIGLVTPYTEDVQQRLVATWARAGLNCVAERHSGLYENFAFESVSNQEIERMTDEVVREGCDAVAIVCTNMKGAPLATGLEARLGVPVLDSVTVTMRACLDLVGWHPTAAPQWGSLFAGHPVSPMAGMSPAQGSGL